MFTPPVGSVEGGRLISFFTVKATRTFFFFFEATHTFRSKLLLLTVGTAFAGLEKSDGDVYECCDEVCRLARAASDTMTL